MNKSEAREFLSHRQPMVSDLDLTEKELDRYVELLQYLEENPDEECLRLLIFSLPLDANEYLSQGVPELLRALPEDRVLEVLAEALESEKKGVRMWAADWALEFPDKRLLKPLSTVLKDPGSDESAVMFAVSALEEIEGECKSPEAAAIIKELYTENKTWDRVRAMMASSDEAFQIMARENAIQEANQAFQEKNFSRVISLLSPHEEHLPEIPGKKLAMARKLYATKKNGMGEIDQLL